ncbi:MAG: hypothetical protein Q9191_001335 [Dirinaria sp. TL-2023a]
MASSVARIIGKRVLKESAANKFGREDPYFENVPATDLSGRPKPGKTKKIKKRINEQIPKEDAEVLTKVKRRAYRLDNAISICGIRFGWSSIIGIIPAIGDFVDLFMAMMVMKTALKVSPGKDRDKLKSTMVMNIMIDFAIGLVPFLGDIADTFFRCNTRNAVALEKMLNKRVKAAAKRAGANGESGRIQEVSSDDEDGPPAYEADDRPKPESGGSKVTVPPKGKPHVRGGGGWFGGQQEADLERGEGNPPPRPPRK